MTLLRKNILVNEKLFKHVEYSNYNIVFWSGGSNKIIPYMFLNKFSVKI